MSKKKLKRQFMGKVDHVGLEQRRRRTLGFEFYAMVEIRLDRVKTFEEAEKEVQKLKKNLVGQDVTLFAP